MGNRNSGERKFHFNFHKASNVTIRLEISDFFKSRFINVQKSRRDVYADDSMHVSVSIWLRHWGEMLKHPWNIEQQARRANAEKWIAVV